MRSDPPLPSTTLFRSDARRRGEAIAQLASVDGRAHVVREAEGTYVAVGDFPFGAGLLLAERDAASGIAQAVDRKSTRLNSSHTVISYAVFCLKKKNNK